ncbi:MAG: lysozyme inhibitor LprI family protein [Parvibaculaceae bacterium]
MRCHLAVLAFFALAVSAPATLSAADNCANASSQAELDACYGKVYEASDKELNALYKQIEGRLKTDPDATKLLVASQKAWISFRDAECAFSTSKSAEGSVYPMLQAICLMGLTEKRIADFKVYLSCQEGDMSCPVPAQ